MFVITRIFVSSIMLVNILYIHFFTYVINNAFVCRSMSVTEDVCKCVSSKQLQLHCNVLPKGFAVIRIVLNIGILLCQFLTEADVTIFIMRKHVT